MCETAGGSEAAFAAPRAARGEAVDPIALQPVDEIAVTTLVDNTYDALIPGDEGVSRTAFGAGVVEAPQFEGGRTAAGLLGEHGFSALVTVRRGQSSSTLLFDTGISPTGMITNAERLGIDFAELRGVVLSHGHFDHAGGLAGLARKRGRAGMPMLAHPLAWTQRRLAPAGQAPFDMPTPSKRALEGQGFEVIERREPSLLLDGAVLITGEVDRTTEFEHGMPPAHEAWTGSAWQHDPLVTDDQALVVHVRDRGLVVLTGCGHAGAVNIVRHAMRLTGVSRLHALLGGLHLSGKAFEPVIPPTVEALTDLSPAVLAPGHCTGWRAQHALAAALPGAWVTSSSGTTYRLAR
jgi:7,8-dihydropterin-6-yl-methyl-4-(beta-D-ribofuranosyl)aminobenzene 5'-phosphate synthase